MRTHLGQSFIRAETKIMTITVRGLRCRVLEPARQGVTDCKHESELFEADREQIRSRKLCNHAQISRTQRNKRSWGRNVSEVAKLSMGSLEYGILRIQNCEKLLADLHIITSSLVPR